MNNNIDKKKTHTLAIVCFCLAIFVFLFSFSSCFNKTVNLCSGKWYSSEFTVGDYVISDAEITVKETDKEALNGILVNEEKYEIFLTFDSKEVEDIQVMYYSKELRIAFTWNTKSVFITTTAQKEQEEIYLETKIVIQEKRESLEEINTVSTMVIMKQRTS